MSTRRLLLLSTLFSLFVVGPMVAPASASNCSVWNVTTASAAYSDLAAAVAEASDGDTLEVMGRCEGGISVERPLTLVGRASYSAPRATITGGGSTESVLVVGNGSLTLRDITVTGSNPVGIYVRGGPLTLRGTSVVRGNAIGIYVEGAPLTLRGTSVVRGNAIGIRSNYPDVSLHDRSRVVDNHGPDYGGGIAMYCGRLDLYDRAAVLRNSAELGGGGIFWQGSCVHNGPVVLHQDSRVAWNNASDGGGILSWGKLVIRGRAAVTHNGATLGGAIWSQGGLVVLRDSAAVTSNAASDWGGGIACFVCTVDMRGSSTLHSNNATTTGGGVELAGGGGRLTLADVSSITANTAGIAGGGVYSGPGSSVIVAPTALVTGNLPDDCFGC